MPVSELHQEIAAIALRAGARHGFALAGGNALLAHELVDRETEDVDLFTDKESGVEAASGAVESALRRAGYVTERQDDPTGLAEVFEGMSEGLAEWLVTAPDGRQTMLQMSYFNREHEPVRMSVGPVLDLEDLIGQKVCALASRVEPRDYIDTAAALERYTPAELIELARRRDPGLDDRDFAEAGRELDRMPEGLFAHYGLGREEVAALREAFADWPRLPGRRAEPAHPGSRRAGRVPGGVIYVRADTEDGDASGMYKPSQEALNLHAADAAEAAERGKLLDVARAADAALREAEASRAPVTEVHRLAKELDAALTAAMRAAYAAERAEIGPRGYEDRIYHRKAKARPAVHALTAEAERLLTLRENHRLNRIPEVPRVPAV